MGPSLKKIRARELAEMTGAERRVAIDRILDLSWRFQTERRPTGLIELQRFYRKVFGDERNR